MMSRCEPDKEEMEASQGYNNIPKQYRTKKESTSEEIHRERQQETDKIRQGDVFPVLGVSVYLVGFGYVEYPEPEEGPVDPGCVSLPGCFVGREEGEDVVEVGDF